MSSKINEINIPVVKSDFSHNILSVFIKVQKYLNDIFVNMEASFV